MSQEYPVIADLLGQTLVSVENIDSDELRFTTSTGSVYRLYHCQDCCESVSIEDVVGDLDDLVGAPLLMAEETTSQENPPDSSVDPEYQDSFTWTFYRFATIKGYVTVRWYGDSNGYYSESVDFEQVS